MRKKRVLKKTLLILAVFALCLTRGLTVFAEAEPYIEEATDGSAVEIALEKTLFGESTKTGEEETTSAPEASALEVQDIPPEESPAGEEAPEELEAAEDTPDGADSPGVAPNPQESQTAQESPAPEEKSGEENMEAGAPSRSEAVVAAADEDNAVVSTYTELKQMLEEDNGYNTFYLGADITGDGTGITINANKTNVVIDGSPSEGERHTFTQYLSSNANTTIQADASMESVTLRNMDIAGNNYYGVVYLPESAKDVLLAHENITYTGPQPFFNRSGTVRILDSGYTLQRAGNMAAGELAEALYAEFGGRVTIDAPDASNSILWLVGRASTLTVLENARVTVNTNGYFLYTSGNKPDVALLAGASFSLFNNSTYGFTYSDQRVGNFTIAENASLYLELETRKNNEGLRVAKLFQMEKGSSATILRTGTAGIPLQLTNANAKAVFNQPDRVFLYNSAGAPLRFTGAGTLSITTSALNVWQSASWPLISGPGELPSHIWNKAGDELLTLRGTYYNARNLSLTHNLLADDPVVSALDADSFDLGKTQLLAFGALTLDIDIPTNQTPALAGSTAPGAELQAAYTLTDSQDGEISSYAGPSGQYLLPVTGGALQVGSTVTATATQNSLTIRQKATVLDGVEYKLAFVSVPGTLSFGSQPIPSERALVNRADLGFKLSVMDSRLRTSPWRIDADMAQPLTAIVGEQASRLTNAVVFKAGEETPLALNEVPMTLYREESGITGEYTVEWNENEGILLHVFPGEVYSNVAYTATIHWELVDAP